MAGALWATEETIAGRPIRREQMWEASLLAILEPPFADFQSIASKLASHVGGLRDSTVIVCLNSLRPLFGKNE